MGLTRFQWLQLGAVALVLIGLIGVAREKLKLERHCRMVATIVTECDR